MTNSTATKVGLGAAFSVASVWFTTHAGAGFATGNQGWQYFASYGVPGMVLPLVSMGLLAWILYEAMLMSQLIGARSYGDVMKHLFHPYDKLYLIFEVFYYCIVLAAVGGVISAATDMVMDVVPISLAPATIIIGIILVLLIIFGADLVRKVATVLGILIIFCGFSIWILGIAAHTQQLGEAISTGFAPNGWAYPLWRSIIYCGFQCVALPALVGCCDTLTTKKSLKQSAVLGFLLNGFGVAVSAWMLVAWHSDITAAGEIALPNLYVCGQLGIPVLFYFYQICLFCCLISTGVGCIFGIVVRLENSIFTKASGIMSNLTAKRLLITVVAILVCMGISTFGLSNIVSTGYQFCGYLGLIGCAVPFLVVGIRKNRKMIAEGKTGLLTDLKK
ncbi:MAG TPA: hypothetical protein H9687_04420 [Firmicutes bacterium]|nr:hypothetical protein [Bacillota bacterium]